MAATSSPPSVNGYHQITVTPVSGAIGAELGGFDLRTSLCVEVIAEIRRALLEYLVVFVRDQKLEPQHFVTFARQFGKLDPHHVLRGMDEAPEILDIVRKTTDQYIFAPGWHADVTWQEAPVLGALLYGVEVPDSGGDTLFSNQYLAYETLSEGMRRVLGKLNAIHSSAHTYGDGAEKLTHVHLMKLDRDAAVKGLSAHPVVRTHPETGRKALFVNVGYTVGLQGMTETESKPLLDFLFAHSTQPEFTCRFRWTPGAIAFWDNRCSIHCPVDDYFGQRRRTWRITLQGDKPH